MSRRSRRFILAVLFARRLVFFAGCLARNDARADVVFGAPSDCPAGTRGFSNHVAKGCAPADCTSDASCRAPGEECALQPLCVRRWETRSPRGTTSSAEADGPCHLGQCREGFVCEVKRRCIPPGLGLFACASLLPGGGLSAIGLVLVLGGAAGIFAARRARARRGGAKPR